jgi:hypothetical protein
VAAVPSHLSRKVCERAERLLEGSLRKVVFNAAIKAYWLPDPAPVRCRSPARRYRGRCAADPIGRPVSATHPPAVDRSDRAPRSLFRQTAISLSSSWNVTSVVFDAIPICTKGKLVAVQV